MTSKNFTSLNFQSLQYLQKDDAFIGRHIGPDADETREMLERVGADSMDDLMAQIVPKKIQLSEPLKLKDAMSEETTLSYLQKMANRNQIFKSYIGMGYYPNHLPAVIQRNVLENPGWYTAYTPYQPEIAQGRLEAILNFQQMTMDLTGMDLASASLLDESTAAAEAMAMAYRVSKSKANSFFIEENCFLQTIDVVKTRAIQLGIEIIVAPLSELENQQIFGALLQYPNSQGTVVDIADAIDSVHQQKGIVAVAADIMALVMLRSPGDLGADIVLGSSQRFGVPMAYGGPHAAFFASRDKYKRSMPGRIIGVSKDTQGNQALRMAMQTREQHIRREKATSNICTAQVLLANMASFYAVYHGPQGLQNIANRIHRLTRILAEGLVQKGLTLINKNYFDTLTIDVNNQKDEIIYRALSAEINLRMDTLNNIGLTLDETTTAEDIRNLWQVLLGKAAKDLSVEKIDKKICKKQTTIIPENLLREDKILQHPVFNQYHSETEMMRYIKRLENRDLALNHSMIALGSCTMKLNAAAEMIPISWPEFAQIHPFVPRDQAQGYKQLIDELEDMLIAITGYDAIAMQPNSGAQGEYAGLLAIRNYLDDNGGEDRNVCLIPSSAHGTNPASAALAGMKVMVVACDEQGNVNIDDLRSKVATVSEQLACIMITYPSTHGVYEEGIKEICEIVHQHGGQVYLDGANMNAQVGITCPGFIGADVSHLNLHKTFAIPHGGGGPGMGPIGVKQHLAPYFPNHSVVQLRGRKNEGGAVSAAPFGSAGILPISWAYIAMTGVVGQRMATEYALLNANYMAARLGEFYPILYRGRNDRVAHECIIDLRPIKAESGITEVDIAKRLMDYGFHAPTMSFPVAGTFMIEPTESESKAELDRFIDAMISIKGEIGRVVSGELDATDNPLKNAPHTEQVITGIWEHKYTREEAAFPAQWVKQNKFWPSVSRIDDVFGDRNLICSCPPIEAYEDE